MDYTHNPNGNLAPGRINHETLARFYGTVPPRRTLDLGIDFSEHDFHEYTQAVEELELPENCDQSVCVEDLGEGFVAVAHKLLSINQ